MDVVGTLFFITVIMAGTVVLVVLPYKVVDRVQRRNCPACLQGTVLFRQDCEGMCPRHQDRWSRIRRLERQMDWPDITAEQRQRGLDDLMRKLGPPPTEPGAASPKEGGIR